MVTNVWDFRIAINLLHIVANRLHIKLHIKRHYNIL